MLQQQQQPKMCETVGVAEAAATRITAAAVAAAATADAATTNPNGVPSTYWQYYIKKLQTTYKNR